MSHTDVIAAIDAAQRALQQARDAVEAQIQIGSVEAPICVKEAAHRFGVDERTARRWAEDGSGFKFAGRWMIYESLIAIPKPNVR